MSKRLIVGMALITAAAAAACSQDRCAMVNTPQWTDLTKDMNLPTYKAQRLETYVHTLEGSCQILASANVQTRTSARVALDREMTKALPLLIPKEDVSRVQSYLNDALGRP